MERALLADLRVLPNLARGSQHNDTWSRLVLLHLLRLILLLHRLLLRLLPVAHLALQLRRHHYFVLYSVALVLLKLLRGISCDSRSTAHVWRVLTLWCLIRWGP